VEGCGMSEPRLKISVLCASRSNPNGLRTVIGALDMLQSRRHDVKFMIAGDMDDSGTLDAIMRMHEIEKMEVYGCCGERQPSLGSVWNKAAASLPGDVYVTITDRMVPITPMWDVFVADSLDKDDTRPVWWNSNAGPLIPIIPQKWYEAAGRIYTTYFPFWFDDTWLHELLAMTFGFPNYLTQAACFINKKSPVTKRMHDLRFWMDFFIAKRPERMEHAKAIRGKLGLPEGRYAAGQGVVSQERYYVGFRVEEVGRSDGRSGRAGRNLSGGEEGGGGNDEWHPPLKHC
jgi:hypothetical protein